MKQNLVLRYLIFAFITSLLFLILFLCGVFNTNAKLAKGTGVQCTWAADDPVCEADCYPICNEPVCQFELCTETPSCRVTCSDQLATDTCPSCEVHCNPYPGCGSPLCESISCNWECIKPKNCRVPNFELSCELPACGIT